MVTPPFSWTDQYLIHKRVYWLALSYYIQLKTSVSAGYVYLYETAWAFHFIFPTAVDTLLMEGGKTQKMMKMYSTEFSKKIPISKAEQTTDRSCFFPEGSFSKILWDSHVTAKSYTAFRDPD